MMGLYEIQVRVNVNVNKSRDFGEYLVYINCKKLWERLINKLVEKCDEDIDGNEMAYNVPLYDYGLRIK